MFKLTLIEQFLNCKCVIYAVLDNLHMLASGVLGQVCGQQGGAETCLLLMIDYIHSSNLTLLAKTIKSIT